MEIEVYIMARNEAKMIPYLVRHYSQFAKLIFLEGNSSDNTIDLAISFGATVYHYDMPDELDDQKHIEIKNTCWKDSKADWVMIIDADEFIYHPDLIKILSETKATIIQPSFHNMFSDKFPSTPGQIYDEVKMGTEDGGIWHSKPIIFKPGEIKEINLHPGSHYASPVGNVNLVYDTGIKILHMRFLGREYVYEHYYLNSYRNSEANRSKGYGVQYDWGPEEIDKIFNNAKLIQVI